MSSSMSMRLGVVAAAVVTGGLVLARLRRPAALSPRAGPGLGGAGGPPTATPSPASGQPGVAKPSPAGSPPGVAIPSPADVSSPPGEASPSPGASASGASGAPSAFRTGLEYIPSCGGRFLVGQLSSAIAPAGHQPVASGLQCAGVQVPRAGSRSTRASPPPASLR